MQELLRMIETFNRSITILNESYLEEQSLYLFLTYLDQLGWLTSPNEHSTGADFKNWINEYCDLTKVRCDAVDLWNTRCSLLHMGTAENRGFNSAVHYRLAFYQNVNLTEQCILHEEARYSSPTKMVDVKALYDCLNDGITKFLETLESDETLRSLVLTKVEKRNNILRPL